MFTIEIIVNYTSTTTEGIQEMHLVCSNEQYSLKAYTVNTLHPLFAKFQVSFNLSTKIPKVWLINLNRSTLKQLSSSGHFDHVGLHQQVTEQRKNQLNTYRYGTMMSCVCM